MRNCFIKKFQFLIIFIISFTLLLSFNVLAESLYCEFCEKNTNFSLDNDKDRMECDVCGHYFGEHKERIIDEKKKEQLDTLILDNNIDDDELLKVHSFFYRMMKDIFSLDNFEDEKVDLFNVKTTMGAISTALMEALNEWGNSPLYKVFVGIGVFLMFVSFIMSWYSNSINNENKTIEQLSRMILQLILASFIIGNVKNIANIIIGIFMATTSQAWSLIKSGSGTDYSEQVRKITINLLKDNNLHMRSPLGIFATFAQSAWLYMQYIIPWIISIVSKFGLLMAIIKAHFNIFINIMMYPIASFDCFDNVKHSNFMKYTKNVASSCLELTIIVLVIYANNLLLSSYIDNMMSNLNQSNDVFNIAVMCVVFQFVKMTMATSVSSGIAKTVFGG